jgi:hypothetical protein
MISIFIDDANLFVQVCSKVFVEEEQWQAHLKGGKHRRALGRKLKLTQNVQKTQSESTRINM